MRKEYDFSKAIPNPYFERLSKEITFRLDFDSFAYFEKLGEPYGMSAEDMIFRYLRHMAGSGYKADLGLLTLEQRRELELAIKKDQKDEV
jgi:hypothetical protein